MNKLLVSLGVLLACAAAAGAAGHTVAFTVAAGKVDRRDEPVCVRVKLPAGVRGAHQVSVCDGTGKQVAVGQLTPAGLVGEAEGKAGDELHFILPRLAAGKSVGLRAVLDPGGAAGKQDAFAWVEKKPDQTELRFGNRPVLCYVHPKLDESSPAARVATFKVFHHAYEPTGARLLTKGVGGLYTHHRGLCYGFMKVGYDKNVVDIWHCPDARSKKKNEAHQADRGVLRSAAGPVLGRHRVAIDWNGVGKKTFAKEERELTAYHVPGGVLIEFASRLTPTGGPVTLDGDPQHAGFHFRADNEVASKTKKETIFTRPWGVGAPGTERNYPQDKKQVNLPWLAMSFVLGGKRYTAAYLDRPDNPKEARFSERTYGRVGSYFVRTVTKDRPLLVRYRVWVQEGQMTPEEVAARSRAFAEPAAVRLR
jgi:hypothetical protein